MNMPEMPATMLMPSAKPRWSTGNASVMIAAELAMSIDAPTPWTMRNTISQIAPCAPVSGSSASTIEPTMNVAKPALYMRTRP
jgi:hypothetical protein